MGYILTPIAVEIDRVAGIVGSRDEALLGDLIATFGDEFGQIDEMAVDRAEDEERDEAPTVRSSLAQMVRGEPYDEGYGFLYGYALEFVCRYFGEYLPNHQWSAMPSGSSWAETVDQGLEAAGVPAKTIGVASHLMNRGAPVEIPEIDDFPGIGYLDRHEVRAAQEALAGAALDAIQDAEVLAAIREIQDWLRTCAESDRGLICFYA